MAVTPIVLSFQAHSLWLAVGLIGLATAAHQRWSVNPFTLPSDLFPPRRRWPRWWDWAATAYLVALTVIHRLVPRMAPAELT